MVKTVKLEIELDEQADFSLTATDDRAERWSTLRLSLTADRAAELYFDLDELLTELGILTLVDDDGFDE